ncbi:CTP synthase N-terminus-domain-containing protein [Dichotomopilus funicola]|uniref:CTP synthase n=1 Tax=Dichotomopilus funicola TaxID=1934379 RepID=A0AAN6V1W5_9PEZI|nr:CTP synthase N-terminus-domain-containing protein [Dichotomopilus funicola]
MPHLPILITLTSLFLALPVFAKSGTPQPKCNTAFFTPLLPAGTTLEKIAVVEKGGTYGEGEANLAFPVDPTNLPALCAVTVAVQSSETSKYRIGLFLPLVKEWTGRFLVVGNGGFGGGINWIEMGSGARYGMATVSTDTGHNSDATDSAWALNQPESRIDWGWRAIHGATVLGKQLVNAYYTKPLTFSYYSGCSTGGRQGLKELQLSPDSFDGALIGAAAWWTSHLNNYLTQVGLFNLPATDPKFLSLDDVAVLAEEVTRQCDGTDGVLDGIISSPERCSPDLTTLLCSSTTSNKCLTEAQISTAQNIYNDFLSTTTTTPAGTPELLHPGLTLSSEPQWDLILNDTEPSPYGVGYARNFLFNDPTWDWRTFNESVIRYADIHDPGDATADDYAALGKVRARGGKVLMYHGLADGLVPTKGSELYVNRTIEALGRGGKGGVSGNPQKSLDDFFRLFLVPGMQHCGGTAVDAPWVFGGSSQAIVLNNSDPSSGGTQWSVPGFEDAEHDALLALVRWVEQGRAVERIVATTWENLVDPASGVKRQRPLCPWPRRAVWDGKGDVDDAERVGKGIIASSTGLLLKTLGHRVSCIKIDPYVSVDAGLMAPAEHGECFVLTSGGEVDLDLGNYERYLSVRLTSEHNITTGKVYLSVIQKERRGDYLGKTVQIVPHVTDSIKEWIKRVSKIPVDGTGEEPDVCIIELGGTIGDIESVMRHEAGANNFMNIHVSYVPTVHGEQKTKPTQHAVKSIRSHGLIPDIVACRCETPLAESTVAKLALFCQVEKEQVLVVRDMPTIYQVPLLLQEQKLVPQLRSKLALDKVTITPDRAAQGSALWDVWTSVVTPTYQEEVKIALVGKYITCQDAYLSVVKALEHSSMTIRRKLNLMWVDSEELEPTTGGGPAQARYHKAWHDVSTAAGIIVPGGFGHRGTEGMMLVSKWARENNIPFLGVCLGFQVAAIQFARDVCGMSGATSEEFDAQAKDRVVVNMPELDKEKMGGTMRLGLRKTIFQQGTEWSRARSLYGGVEVIEERHRHRYEINPELVEKLENAGLHFVGKDETGERMEVFELKDHPFFVGTQFHAEYQSQVVHPSRPYLGFVAASAGRLDDVLKQKPVEGFKTVPIHSGAQ